MSVCFVNADDLNAARIYNVPTVFFENNKEAATENEPAPTAALTEDERMLEELAKDIDALKDQADAEVKGTLKDEIDAYFLQTKKYTLEEAGAYGRLLNLLSCTSI